MATPARRDRRGPHETAEQQPRPYLTDLGAEARTRDARGTDGDEATESALVSGAARRPRGANGRYVRGAASPEAVPGSAELPDNRFLDREMSWLQFNERVLQLAGDPDVHLLERTRFLSIFASNLDEFFMVRVAGLKRRIATGLAVQSASGLEPRELLDRILGFARHLMEVQARTCQDQVRPALADEGISLLHWDELTSAERQRLSHWFGDRVFPVLTPLAVDPAHPFPYISGLSLNLAVMLVNPTSGTEHFARIKVPPLLPRLVELDKAVDAGDDVDRFVPLEEVIAAHLDELFPGMDVHEHYTFRVTRNEDLEVEEDDAENLLTAMEKELSRRRFGPPVRLEVDAAMDDHVLRLLIREMQISPQEVFRLPTPLDLRCLADVADLDRTELKYPNFVPRTHPDLARVETATPANILAAVRAKDVLVQHPYDSFSTSVQTFVEQAAADPRVLAMKQTLYRTSGDSPIIDALIAAAESGKQVLAVIELKARFDEQANIEWARKLEQAGVHVVYGVVGLKTHCKLSLVVRQESEGLRRYCHVGTGNYHPKTARLYEDFGLFTCDPQVGEDLTRLFNQLSGWALATEFERLLVAPRSLRPGLLAHIEDQTEKASTGEPAYIGIKVNSIVDEKLIDALYRASQAGVEVDVLVRGICALRPGVPGLSERIRVRSILGRFLEHSRVFVFGPGGSAAVLIGSADLMHRNLDRRVEALVHVRDPGHIEELVHVLAQGMDDGTASWHLDGEGRWTRFARDSDGAPLQDLQSLLIEEHAQRRRQTRAR